MAGPGAAELHHAVIGRGLSSNGQRRQWKGNRIVSKEPRLYADTTEP